jgi:hypothetical protein
MPPTPDTLTELLAERASIDAEFVPTLAKYTEMAKKALDLQIRIVEAMLRRAAPSATHKKRLLVLTIPARLHPAQAEALLGKLTTQQPTPIISEVVFDPAKAEYSVFAEVPRD